MKSREKAAALQPEPFVPRPSGRPASVFGAARIALIAGGILGAVLVALHAWAVSGFGPWALPGIELLFLPVLAALLAIPLGVLLAAFERTRSEGAACLSACVVLILVGLLSHFVADRVRIRGFERAATRAAPLVAALHRYYDAHGQAPESLEALVPRYLGRLPGRLPELELVAGEEAQRRFDGNPWALWVCVPTGVINWDQFLYYPLQNYPEVDHGGWLEPVGDWRYVRE